uniref:Pentatricopeptide repeat-containing protein n=1 Tax=Ananas comosus var. bracteatus TaxID=296719 RepID=A0A6V7NJA3_ANACO|nr:unnamed protein product [Ananas comosus var. bracteatus]
MRRLLLLLRPASAAPSPPPPPPPPPPSNGAALSSSKPWPPRSPPSSSTVGASPPLLLRSLIRPPLPSSLFLRVLSKLRSHPLIALRFFRFAVSNLAFAPDLRSRAAIVRILVDADLLGPARVILDPAIRSEPSAAPLLDSVLRSTTYAAGKSSRSRILSFILESYSSLRFLSSALETLARIRVLGCLPTARSCNSLLRALCSRNRIRAARDFYALILRSGYSIDSRTWAILTWLLCKEGKLHNARRLLDLGHCGVSSYDLVIYCYCRKGELVVAIRLLNELFEMDLSPKFSTFSSILDGACKFGDDGVMKLMLREIIVRGYLPTVPSLDYNYVVQWLCESGKSYAAEMFLEKAQSRSFRLGNDSFMCLLSALSKAGRVEEAIRFYQIMLRDGFEVNPGCCDAFVSGLCKGEPSEEVDGVLKDLIRAGILPNSSDISKYIASQCRKGLWKEATSLLDGALDRGILVDGCSCSSLVEYYFSNGLVDSVISLHERMKILGHKQEGHGEVIISGFHDEWSGRLDWGGDALCIGGCRELADIEGGFQSGVVEQHGMLQQVDGGQDGVSSVKGALDAPWGLTPGA